MLSCILDGYVVLYCILPCVCVGDKEDEESDVEEDEEAEEDFVSVCSFPFFVCSFNNCWSALYMS